MSFWDTIAGGVQEVAKGAANLSNWLDKKGDQVQAGLEKAGQRLKSDPQNDDGLLTTIAKGAGDIVLNVAGDIANTTLSVPNLATRTGTAIGAGIVGAAKGWDAVPFKLSDAAGNTFDNPITEFKELGDIWNNGSGVNRVFDTIDWLEQNKTDGGIVAKGVDFVLNNPMSLGLGAFGKKLLKNSADDIAKGSVPAWKQLATNRRLGEGVVNNIESVIGGTKKLLNPVTNVIEQSAKALSFANPMKRSPVAQALDTQVGKFASTIGRGIAMGAKEAVGGNVIGDLLSPIKKVVVGDLWGATKDVGRLVTGLANPLTRMGTASSLQIASSIGVIGNGEKGFFGAMEIGKNKERFQDEYGYDIEVPFYNKNDDQYLTDYYNKNNVPEDKRLYGQELVDKFSEVHTSKINNTFDLATDIASAMSQSYMGNSRQLYNDKTNYSDIDKRGPITETESTATEDPTDVLKNYVERGALSKEIARYVTDSEVLSTSKGNILNNLHDLNRSYYNILQYYGGEEEIKKNPELYKMVVKQFGIVEKVAHQSVLETEDAIRKGIEVNDIKGNEMTKRAYDKLSDEDKASLNSLENQAKQYRYEKANINGTVKAITKTYGDTTKGISRTLGYGLNGTDGIFAQMGLGEFASKNPFDSYIGNAMSQLNVNLAEGGDTLLNLGTSRVLGNTLKKFLGAPVNNAILNKFAYLNNNKTYKRAMGVFDETLENAGELAMDLPAEIYSSGNENALGNLAMTMGFSALGLWSRNRTNTETVEAFFNDTRNHPKIVAYAFGVDPEAESTKMLFSNGAMKDIAGAAIVGMKEIMQTNYGVKNIATEFAKQEMQRSMLHSYGIALSKVQNDISGILDPETNQVNETALTTIFETPENYQAFLRGESFSFNEGYINSVMADPMVSAVLEDSNKVIQKYTKIASTVTTLDDFMAKLKPVRNSDGVEMNIAFDDDVSRTFQLTKITGNVQDIMTSSGMKNETTIWDKNRSKFVKGIGKVDDTGSSIIDRYIDSSNLSSGKRNQLKRLLKSYGIDEKGNINKAGYAILSTPDIETLEANGDDFIKSQMTFNAGIGLARQVLNIKKGGQLVIDKGTIVANKDKTDKLDMRDMLTPYLNKDVEVDFPGLDKVFATTLYKIDVQGNRIVFQKREYDSETNTIRSDEQRIQSIDMDTVGLKFYEGSYFDSAGEYAGGWIRGNEIKPQRSNEVRVVENNTADEALSTEEVIDTDPVVIDPSSDNVKALLESRPIKAPIEDIQYTGSITVGDKEYQYQRYDTSEQVKNSGNTVSLVFYDPLVGETISTETQDIELSMGAKVQNNIAVVLDKEGNEILGRRLIFFKNKFEKETKPTFKLLSKLNKNNKGNTKLEIANPSKYLVPHKITLTTDKWTFTVDMTPAREHTSYEIFDSIDQSVNELPQRAAEAIRNIHRDQNIDVIAIEDEDIIAAAILSDGDYDTMVGILSANMSGPIMDVLSERRNFDTDGFKNAVIDQTLRGESILKKAETLFAESEDSQAEEIRAEALKRGVFIPAPDNIPAQTNKDIVDSVIDSDLSKESKAELLQVMRETKQISKNDLTEAMEDANIYVRDGLFNLDMALDNEALKIIGRYFEKVAPTLFDKKDKNLIRQYLSLGVNFINKEGGLDKPYSDFVEYLNDKIVLKNKREEQSRQRIYKGLIQDVDNYNNLSQIRLKEITQFSPQGGWGNATLSPEQTLSFLNNEDNDPTSVLESITKESYLNLLQYLKDNRESGYIGYKPLLLFISERASYTLGENYKKFLNEGREYSRDIQEEIVQNVTKVFQTMRTAQYTKYISSTLNIDLDLNKPTFVIDNSNYTINALYLDVNNSVPVAKLPDLRQEQIEEARQNVNIIEPKGNLYFSDGRLYKIDGQYQNDRILSNIVLNNLGENTNVAKFESQYMDDTSLLGMKNLFDPLFWRQVILSDAEIDYSLEEISNKLDDPILKNQLKDNAYLFDMLVNGKTYYDASNAIVRLVNIFEGDTVLTSKTVGEIDVDGTIQNIQSFFANRGAGDGATKFANLISNYIAFELAGGEAATLGVQTNKEIYINYLLGLNINEVGKIKRDVEQAYGVVINIDTDPDILEAGYEVDVPLKNRIAIAVSEFLKAQPNDVIKSQFVGERFSGNPSDNIELKRTLADEYANKIGSQSLAFINYMESIGEDGRIRGLVGQTYVVNDGEDLMSLVKENPTDIVTQFFGTLKARNGKDDNYQASVKPKLYRHKKTISYIEGKNTRADLKLMGVTAPIGNLGPKVNKNETLKLGRFLSTLNKTERTKVVAHMFNVDDKENSFIKSVITEIIDNPKAISTYLDKYEEGQIARTSDPEIGNEELVRENFTIFTKAIDINMDVTANLISGNPEDTVKNMNVEIQKSKDLNDKRAEADPVKESDKKQYGKAIGVSFSPSDAAIKMFDIFKKKVADESNRSGVSVLYGFAGSGKSTLTGGLYRHLWKNKPKGIEYINGNTLLLTKVNAGLQSTIEALPSDLKEKLPKTSVPAQTIDSLLVQNSEARYIHPEAFENLSIGSIKSNILRAENMPVGKIIFIDEAHRIPEDALNTVVHSLSKYNYVILSGDPYQITDNNIFKDMIETPGNYPMVESIVRLPGANRGTGLINFFNELNANARDFLEKSNYSLIVPNEGEGFEEVVKGSIVDKFLEEDGISKVIITATNDRRKKYNMELFSKRKDDKVPLYSLFKGEGVAVNDFEYSSLPKGKIEGPITIKGIGTVRYVKTADKLVILDSNKSDRLQGSKLGDLYRSTGVKPGTNVYTLGYSIVTEKGSGMKKDFVFVDSDAIEKGAMYAYDAITRAGNKVYYEQSNKVLKVLDYNIDTQQVGTIIEPPEKANEMKTFKGVPQFVFKGTVNLAKRIVYYTEQALAKKKDPSLDRELYSIKNNIDIYNTPESIVDLAEFAKPILNKKIYNSLGLAEIVNNFKKRTPDPSVKVAIAVNQEYNRLVDSGLKDADILYQVKGMIYDEIVDPQNFDGLEGRASDMKDKEISIDADIASILDSIGLPPDEIKGVDAVAYNRSLYPQSLEIDASDKQPWDIALDNLIYKSGKFSIGDQKFENLGEAVRYIYDLSRSPFDNNYEDNDVALRQVDDYSKELFDGGDFICGD